MISVNQLYNDVSTLSRKSRGGGFLSDTIFNIHLKNAEKALFQRFYKVYEETQDIIDHIRPFVVYNNLIQTNSLGVMTFPDTYAHKLALEGVYVANPKKKTNPSEVKRYECPLLRSSEVATFLSDIVAKPDFDKRRFYHTFRNNSIQVFPERKMWVGITYFRYPVYGYITHTVSDAGGQDKYTYDPTASLDLEWNDITYGDFINKICELLGISTNSPEFVQLVNTTVKDTNSMLK